MMFCKLVGLFFFIVGKGFDGKVVGDRGNKVMGVDLVRLFKM